MNNFWRKFNDKPPVIYKQMYMKIFHLKLKIVKAIIYNTSHLKKAEIILVIRIKDVRSCLETAFFSYK